MPLKSFEDEFQERMQDPEFRATYYQLEAAQVMKALELACMDHGSVRLGHEALPDKMGYYLLLACDQIVTSDGELPKQHEVLNALKALALKEKNEETEPGG